MNYFERIPPWRNSCYCSLATIILLVGRWLLNNRQEGCTESAIDGACWNGHSETVEWLVNDWGQEISERALDYAASTGRLEVCF